MESNAPPIPFAAIPNDLSPPAAGSGRGDSELREKQERLRRYGTSEFTRELLQHAKEATKAAMLDAQESQKQ